MPSARWATWTIGPAPDRRRDDPTPATQIALPSCSMRWLAHSAVRRPVYWLLGGILVTLCLAAGIPKLELKTNGAALYPEDNAVIERSEADRLRFGEPRHIVVLAGCSASGCLATPEGFRFLHRVQIELESLSAVRGDDVQSVASLLRVEQQGESLRLDRYLDRIPEDRAAFRDLLATIRAHPLTDGLLLSPDARLASFLVPLAEHRPVGELVAELESWRDLFDTDQFDEGFDLRLTGPELAEATLGESVLRDLSVLVPIMLVVVSILLYLTVGSGAGVMIPMVEAGTVLLWTFGMMGWLGIPVTLVTTILPVVLMAMAITDEIHLLERIGAQEPSLSRAEAVLTALDQVGRPIIITSMTTALGFLSFLSASIQPIREFGMFTGFGILIAMLLTFTCIPALIVLLPESWIRRRSRPWSLPGFGLEALARSSIRRPTVALVAGLILLLIAIPGALSLRVQDSWVDNFDPQSSIARADRVFNAAFWGSYRYDIVFEALPDYFYSPAGTLMVEEFEAVAAELPGVGGIESFTIPLNDIARAIGKKPPLSKLPPLAISDLAILAEMSGARSALRRLLTEHGEAARVRLYVNDPDYAKSVALRTVLEKRLAEFPRSDFIRVHSSGDLPVAIEVVGEIVMNQMRSIAWALASVALVLAVFFGPRLSGLVAMVPVIAATSLASRSVLRRVCLRASLWASVSISGSTSCTDTGRSARPGQTTPARSRPPSKRREPHCDGMRSYSPLALRSSDSRASSPTTASVFYSPPRWWPATSPH